jgi:hypothetical protein
MSHLRTLLCLPPRTSLSDARIWALLLFTSRFALLVVSRPRPRDREHRQLCVLLRVLACGLAALRMSPLFPPIARGGRVVVVVVAFKRCLRVPDSGDWKDRRCYICRARRRQPFCVLPGVPLDTITMKWLHVCVWVCNELMSMLCSVHTLLSGRTVKCCVSTR